MSCKNLEELREEEIESFTRAGYRIIACEYGFNPSKLIYFRGLDLKDRDAEDIIAQHKLWTFLKRQDGHRAVHVSWVLEFSDECHVAKRAWESEGPWDLDVPISVVAKMLPDDAGADPHWRNAVYRFWKKQNRVFRQLSLDLE